MTEQQPSRHVFVGWAKDAPPATEFADVRISASGISARGVVLSGDPVPYRLSYEIATDAEMVSTRLSLTSIGEGWRRSLELYRTSDGSWVAEPTDEGAAPFRPPGGDTAVLAGALDADLESSPLFNTMPVLRHRLHEGGESGELLMAWVSTPDLTVRPSRQRYTHLGQAPDGEVVRFDTVDGDFTAEIVFGDDALVLDYPGIGSRLLTDAARHE